MEKLNQKKILVIGGSGFLGSYLIKRLLSRGCQVKSLSRSAPLELRALGIEVCLGSIINYDEVARACKDCDLVFLVAAKIGFWGSWKEYYETNVMGAQNVIKACHQHLIKHLVYTSTPSVAYSGNKDIIFKDESIGYAPFYVSNYPKSKAMAEQLVLNANSSHLKTVALRPHVIWGIGDRHIIPRILNRIESKRFFKIGDANPKVDMTHVENAAEAHILAAEQLIQAEQQVSGKAYFISDDQPVLIWPWVQHLVSELGLKNSNRTISKQLAYFFALTCEGIYSAFSLKAEPPISRFLIGQISHSHYFDISAAKRDFGYQQVIQPASALKEYITHLKTQLSNKPTQMFS